MFTIYITEDVFNGILSHAKQYGENEVIGKLVGRPYKHPTVDYRFVDIWGHVPVESISTPVSVKYSPGALEDLGEDLLTDYEEDIVVGWYHSHPGHGCFLSAQDIETQQRNYLEWYHCALVVDPYRNEFKFFRVERGRPLEVEYYIYRRK